MPTPDEERRTTNDVDVDADAPLPPLRFLSRLA